MKITLSYDWVKEFVRVNEMANKNGKQIFTVEIEASAEVPPVNPKIPDYGWNHIRFNYENIGA
jgi:hypothetical protein